MQKIIMIRFSLRIHRFEQKAKIFNETDRNKWLENRIRLFNNVTYPSVSQHDANVVFFMSKGDEWAYEEMNKNENFIPIFTDNIEIKMISDDFLQKNFKKEKLYILRLDSDDAIHKDFFDVEVPINSFVAQPWGIKWDGRRTSTLSFPSNPFVMSYTDTYLNPFAFQHTAIMEKNPQIIERDPMWLMNIHGGNIINGFSVKDIDWTQKDLSGFGL